MQTSVEDKSVTRAATSQSGFTIMEVLIVLAIIALIMGVLVGPKIIGQAQEAQIETTRTVLKQYVTAYARWQIDSGQRCPQNLSELEKYVAKEGTTDPWGTEYVMVCGNNAPPAAKPFGMSSLGPDGQAGTEDDINSWDKKGKKK